MRRPALFRICRAGCLTRRVPRHATTSSSRQTGYVRGWIGVDRIEIGLIAQVPSFAKCMGQQVPAAGGADWGAFFARRGSQRNASLPSTCLALTKRAMRTEAVFYPVMTLAA